MSRSPARAIGLGLVLLSLGCARPPAAPRVVAAAPVPIAAPAPAAPEAAPAPPAPEAAAPAPERETFEPRAELPDVHFASGEVRVERRDLKTLDSVVAWLKANPDQLIIVEGNTDAVGPRAANLALAQRRARWVMGYLVARGVATERVTAVARGESDTACADRSAACRSKNRRVRFLVRDSGTLRISAFPSP
jgi:outer membrane protein OmpA-like peptidoglycan-associated protein